MLTKRHVKRRNRFYTVLNKCNVRKRRPTSHVAIVVFVIPPAIMTMWSGQGEPPWDLYRCINNQRALWRLSLRNCVMRAQFGAKPKIESLQRLGQNARETGIGRKIFVIIIDTGGRETCGYIFRYKHIYVFLRYLISMKSMKYVHVFLHISGLVGHKYL